MKYNDNGEYKDIYVKAFDTLPIGTQVNFNGTSADIPNGWEQVGTSGNLIIIEKTSQYIEGGATLSNTYGTSQEDGYTQEYLNNYTKDSGWVSVPLETGFTGNLYVRKIGKIVNVVGIDIAGSFVNITKFATIPDGFRPPYQTNDTARNVNQTTTPFLKINIGTLGYVRLVDLAATTNTTIQFSMTYFVD